DPTPLLESAAAAEAPCLAVTGSVEFLISMGRLSKLLSVRSGRSPAGQMNMTITAAIATVVSPISELPLARVGNHATQPPPGPARKIQASAVTARMVSNRISEVRQGPGSGTCNFSPSRSPRVIHHHTAGNNTQTIGIATIIQ